MTIFGVQHEVKYREYGFNWIDCRSLPPVRKFLVPHREDEHDTRAFALEGSSMMLFLAFVSMFWIIRKINSRYLFICVKVQPNKSLKLRFSVFSSYWKLLRDRVKQFYSVNLCGNRHTFLKLASIVLHLK